jgi:hypothetical protein
VKFLLYVVGGFAATVFLAYIISVGLPHGPGALVAFALVGLFAIPCVGALWMMYISIRCEKKPLPLLLLAIFIPFSFLWYYFERVRPRSLENRGAR